MKTIKLTCYVQVPSGATGVDPAIAVLMTGNLKLAIISHDDRDYGKLKGIEYCNGVYKKQPPKEAEPQQERLL